MIFPSSVRHIEYRNLRARCSSRWLSTISGYDPKRELSIAWEIYRWWIPPLMFSWHETIFSPKQELSIASGDFKLMGSLSLRLSWCGTIFHPKRKLSIVSGDLKLMGSLSEPLLMWNDLPSKTRATCSNSIKGFSCMQDSPDVEQSSTQNKSYQFSALIRRFKVFGSLSEVLLLWNNLPPKLRVSILPGDLKLNFPWGSPNVEQNSTQIESYQFHWEF